jgi:hypothetical protein
MKNSVEKTVNTIVIDVNYESNKKCVQDYVNCIIGLNMNPPHLCKNDRDVDDEFYKDKADAGKWNSFISDLNTLPSLVTVKGSTVDGHLSLLIQYANQIKNNEPYDVNAIKTEANAIINLVNDIDSAIKNVLPKLTDFNVPLKNGCWRKFFSDLQDKERYYYAHNKKGQDLHNIENWMDTYLGQIQPVAQPAPTSSQYLVDYWTKASNLFEKWLKDYQFSSIVQNPTSISTTVLDKAQTDWNNNVYKPFKQ